MSRTGRKHSGTGIYHVMLRGVNRQGVFEEPEDYREGWNQNPVPMILKDAMKAYDKWVQKNNGKIFKYEIDKDNPNN